MAQILIIYQGRILNHKHDS